MADSKDDETTGRALEIRGAGPQVTVQDLGRSGNAHLGVPRWRTWTPLRTAWPTDWWATTSRQRRWSACGGQLSFRTRTAVTIAVTGARVPVTVEGRGQEWGNAVLVPAGRWWSWVG